MTLTNQERATRCQMAIADYSDDDHYTSLVDFLADAMHWCRIHGHRFVDVLDTAVMHFEAEAAGDDILGDLNRQPFSERTKP